MFKKSVTVAKTLLDILSEIFNDLVKKDKQLYKGKF